MHPLWVCPPPLFFVSSSSKRETDQHDFNLKLACALWNRSCCFGPWSVVYLGFTTQGPWVFHPPTTRFQCRWMNQMKFLWLSHPRTTVAVPKFPYHHVRMESIQYSLFLWTVFRVLRYRWLHIGVVSSLTETDRYFVAVTNFAAWDEFCERLTDESGISPLAGALESSVVILHSDPAALAYP